MSLRSRLALLILALFLAGTVVVLGRTLQHAQREVARRSAYSQQVDPSRSQMPDLTALPQWFVTLMGGDALVFTQGAKNSGGDFALRQANAAAQILDLWDDTKNELISRLGSLLMLNIIIYLILGRWLRSIDHILAALHEIEKGDFSKRIALIGMRELDQISSNINHLTEVLGAAKVENERLQSESISKGERERLRLARELHDSLGQSITAIKAVSASIGLRTREQMPEIADSAQHIEKISETAYAAVRNMISSLRPSVLDELGLVAGLQQMVDDWNIHHESTFCRLRIDAAVDSLDGEQAINLYRIVQEALNNIAKYAKATDASVNLNGNEVLTLVIEDNGIGFNPATIKKGMGLWNIQDRVNLLQGKFHLASSPGNGLRLSMEIPRNQRKRKT